QLADELDLRGGEHLAAVAKCTLHAPERSRGSQRTQAPTLFFSTCPAHRPPHWRSSGRGGVPARQQHVKLRGLQILHHGPAPRPESESSARQTLLTQPKPSPVIPEHLQRRLPA